MNKRIQSLKALYLKAKEANVGAEVKCPSCGTPFTKSHYQQTFCKTKGGTVCKDHYWNNVTPSKRNNKTRISPASAAWMENRDDELRPMNTLATGKFQGYTTEGYIIFNGIAFDEFDEEVYRVDEFDDDQSWDAHKER